ncbi:MAG: ABC transporter ATP-binding protein/permease, partial [Treponema sp.]|nr:ABC transporter ATP-binding protein/permease [Treponema sp.]
ILQVIVLCFTLAYFSPFIILIAFIGMIVTVWGNLVNAKKWFKVDMLQTRPNRFFDYIKRIFYMTLYSKDIKITNIKDILFKKYDEQVILMKKIISKEWPPIAAVAIIVSWLFNFVVIGVSGIFVIFRISKNLMTIGDFVSVNSAVRHLSAIMCEFSNIIPELTKHSLYIDNYLKVLNYESKMLVSHCAVSISPAAQHTIKIDNISFSYKNSVNPVIKDLTLSIKAGEHIAIVGENGAGKSTLIKLITRLYDPSSGNISIDDKQYSDIIKESLYGSFAIVLQDFQTYAFSLRENITLSDNSTAADIENINKILDIVDLKNLINELPNGYDTILTNELDDNGTNLSGGQLQRLAIARAIFQNTSIIIMDEPTSALDPINEARIFNIIDEICKDKTLILISHRLSGVKNMDKILYMENGQIMESGSHKELMDMNQKYSIMFRTQAERYKED